ncbi:MAG: cupredoxin domain-containing protein, partial [Nanoarchaeota archaeon]
ATGTPEEKGESSSDSATEGTTKLTLNAKKWVFQPNVLRVKKGSKVALTVVPSGLDFTFAVPSLGVEKKVVGTTEVVFTADKAGTYDFTCGSCEDWRGMRGNLVVESK